MARRLHDDVGGDVGFGQRREDRRGNARSVGNPHDREPGDVFLVRDASYPIPLFHDRCL